MIVCAVVCLALYAMQMLWHTLPRLTGSPSRACPRLTNPPALPGAWLPTADRCGDSPMAAKDEDCTLTDTGRCGVGHLGSFCCTQLQLADMGEEGVPWACLPCNHAAASSLLCCAAC